MRRFLSFYPQGLAGESIPESARIVAVADVFDALASRRPYKEAWPIDAVIDKIKEGSATHFDPAMVDAFLSALPRILEVKAHWDKQEAEFGENLPDSLAGTHAQSGTEIPPSPAPRPF